MDWKNAGKSILPEDKQEVLIEVNDVKYVAVFDLLAKGFRILNNSDKKFVPLKDNRIYWTEIRKPA